MLGIIITALIILLVGLARNVTYSTNAKDLVRNDNVNDMLKEILQRIDRIERNMEQMKTSNMEMERNNNIRFDRMESHMDRMETKNNIRFDQLEADNKNLTVTMETIVEQQMVITAEIFTVSQTLPFCCCHYQNTPGPEQPDTTTETPFESTTATPLKSLPSNCAEAMGESGSDGVYKVNITNSDIGPFDVYCMKKVAKLMEEEIINGTWLIIQRRQDNTTDFYRNWNSYKHGFGDLKRNFWIGLDKLYALTKSMEQQLWVQLQDRDGIPAWAKYYRFAIGDEKEKYALKSIAGYAGTAGDSLHYHKGQMWTTYDKDNDHWTENCASDQYYTGAWWFDNCANCSLNGIYDHNKGILWNTFRGWSHSLKYAHMAIRPMS